jgi:hypothetical protein
VLLGTTAVNWPSAKPKIAERLAVAAKGKLAADASLDDVHSLLDSLDKEGEGEPEEMADSMPPDEGNGAAVDPQEPGETTEDASDPMDAILKFLATKLAPEDMQELRAMAGQAKDRAGARDEETPEQKADRERKEKEATDKDARDNMKAMDSKIATAVSDAEQRIRHEAHATREAERIVRPWVGELAIAQDSARDVFRVALETLGVDTKGKHPDALKDILLAQPKPGDRKASPFVAQDAAASASFASRYPEASRIRSI